MVRKISICVCAAMSLVAGALGAWAQDMPAIAPLAADTAPVEPTVQWPEDADPVQAEAAQWQQPQEAAPAMRPAYDDNSNSTTADVQRVAAVVEVPAAIPALPSVKLQNAPTGLIGHWPLLLVGFGVVLSFFSAAVHGARM